MFIRLTLILRSNPSLWALRRRDLALLVLSRGVRSVALAHFLALTHLACVGATVPRRCAAMLCVLVRALCVYVGVNSCTLPILCTSQRTSSV